MRLHNRQIKAAFWNDPDLLQWPRDKRWFYEGLSQLSDDSGCIENSPFAFKLHLFPSPLDDDISVKLITKWVDELINHEKLIPYESSGKRCLFIVNFHKHQTLRSPAPPEVPIPPWVTFIPSEKQRRSGTYIIGSYYDYLTPTVQSGYGDLTVGVQSGYGDQPEPEPEPEPEEKEKEKEKVPHSEIVAHLNEVCGTNFKASNKATQRHINARWNDGFRLDDFKAVVKIKSDEWGKTPDWVKFLRPETLFGTKFEGYLNQARASPPTPVQSNTIEFTPEQFAKYANPPPRRAPT